MNKCSLDTHIMGLGYTWDTFQNGGCHLWSLNLKYTLGLFQIRHTCQETELVILSKSDKKEVKGVTEHLWFPKKTHRKN